MNNPLVSVIIPVYNGEKYIAEAIDSVLAQTYPAHEIIVTDDGSTDKTASVVKEYMKSPSHHVAMSPVEVRYIYQSNKGPAAARNAGIKIAKGEYIAFLDADDIWLSEKLEIQIREMEDGVGLVGTKSDAYEKENISYRDLLIKNRFSNSSVLVKKECFDKVGLLDERPEFRAVEDWDMWIRISKKYQTKFINKPLVKISTSSNGLCSPSNAGKMLKNELAVLKKHFLDNKDIFLRMKTYSYRYFCASWAYFVSGDRANAGRYIFKAFLYNPFSFLNKRQGGLMVRIILDSILRFNIPVNRLTKPLFKLIYNIHVFIREFLIWFFKFIYFEPLFRSQCSHVGKNLWMEKLPYIVGKGNIEIGDFVRISGKPNIAFSTKIFDRPRLIIGNHTFIGHATSFAVAKEIKIGKHCYISGGVTISDNDGHPLDYAKRRSNMPPEKEAVKEVIIGNDVWIGRGAFILKGVTVGGRAIIGANAVVTKDVESDCVAAGNPAVAIKRLEKV